MKKVIAAFFSGTGFRIDSPDLLAARLHSASLKNDKQLSFGFNGTRVDYGIGGVLWGTGIDEQCQQVIKQVKAELKAGHKVVLNAYGHSRGGIAALLLAKQLGRINPELLEVNLALLDPVPGNLIATSSSDFLNISLANKTMDLSDCQTLKHVLAIYPYGPLPAIACHAPLFPVYPSSADVDEDVSIGTHSEAENMSAGLSNTIAAKRVYEFLSKHGSQFDETKAPTKCMISDKDLLQMYHAYMCITHEELHTQSVRAAHSAKDRFIEVSSDESKPYFNRHHQQLAGAADNPETRIASIKQSTGMWPSFKNIFKNNPIIGHAIKWGMIGTGLAASVFFTGGLAAIPYLAAVVAKIGFTSAFLGSSVLLGGMSAGVWQVAVLPLLKWGAERFYYPNYQVLEIAQDEIKPAGVETANSSTHRVLKSMDKAEPNNALVVDNNIEVPSPKVAKASVIEIPIKLPTSENKVEVKQDHIEEEDDVIEEIYSPNYFK